MNRIIEILGVRNLSDDQCIELRDYVLKYVKTHKTPKDYDFIEVMVRKLNRFLRNLENYRQHGSLPEVFWAEPPIVPTVTVAGARHYYQSVVNSNPINPEYATATYQTQPYVWYSGTSAAAGTGEANP